MTSPKIVVSDHDPVYLEMIQTLLEEEGYLDVVCVPGGDVLELAKQHPVSLVLIDVSIAAPDEGWQVIAKLRLEAQTIHIPIIICSTDPKLPLTKADMLRAMNCHFLEKPFNLDTLLQLVAQLIGPPVDG